jgi:putative copper export protein
LTLYGRVLLAKLALVAVVLGAGAFNWKRQTPRMHAAEGVAAMRRSARRELALGALVFLLTAVLVATPLPGE